MFNPSKPCDQCIQPLLILHLLITVVRVHFGPVICDLFSGSKPYTVVLFDVLEKLSQTSNSGRSADNPSVQTHRKHLWTPFIALFV